MKIKYQLTLVLILFSFFLISLLALNFYFSARNILLDEIASHLEIISSEKGLLVETRINKKYELATLIASDRLIRRNLFYYITNHNKKVHQEEITTSLKDYSDAIEEIDKVNIITAGNEIIASSDRKNINTFYSRPENLTQRKKGIFYRAIFFKDEGLALSIVVPIFYQGQQTGVVEIEHKAASLLRAVKDYTGLDKSGESYITDRAKQIYLTPLRFDTNAALTRKSEDTFLKRKENFLIGEDYRGEKVIYATVTIASQDWDVITKMDIREALSPIFDLRKNLLMMYILAIILTIPVAFILGNFLARPLEALMKNIHKVKEGDFSTRAFVKSNNETGILSNAFNEMAARLETTIGELHRSNESLSKYAYVITHDLRAPLQALTGLSRIIHEEYNEKLDDEGRRILDMQQKKIDQMNMLIEEVLQSARQSETRSKEPLDIKEILQNIITDINPPPIIRINMPDKFPSLEYPKISFIQIFQNLLSNAVRYMDKPAGSIDIGCMENEKEYVFSVRDNGTGIKQEDFERIFIMFAARNIQKEESSGIGLSIVKKIVEDNKGRIWLESEPGKGSTFYFTIPK